MARIYSEKRPCIPSSLLSAVRAALSNTLVLTTKTYGTSSYASTWNTALMEISKIYSASTQSSTAQILQSCSTTTTNRSPKYEFHFELCGHSSTTLRWQHVSWNWVLTPLVTWMKSCRTGYRSSRPQTQQHLSRSTSCVYRPWHSRLQGRRCWNSCSYRVCTFAKPRRYVACWYSGLESTRAESLCRFR